MAESRNIRFLLFPSGKELSRCVHPNETVAQIRNQLYASWPKDLPKLDNVEALRLIFSGKQLRDVDKLADVVGSSPAVTIHMVIRKVPELSVAIPAAASGHGVDFTTPMPVPRPGAPSGFAQWSYVPHTVSSLSSMSGSPMSIGSSAPSSPSGWGEGLLSDDESRQSDEELDSASTGDSGTESGDSLNDWHFHGCMFDEAEWSQTQQIFERKKGSDNMMSFTDMHAFLRTYWRWMAQRGFIDAGREFPMASLMELKRKIVGHRDRITCSEFRMIFFLLDNTTPDERCPHGERERIARTAEEMHKGLYPDHPFNREIFDATWSTVDIDGDNCLTCKEIELLLYLYASNLSEATPIGE